MYHVSYTVYYPDQQMHNIYINNILYIVSTYACFNVSAVSSGSLLTLFFAVLVFPVCWDTGNTNTGITPIRLSRLYMQPPHQQLLCVIIINVLQTLFYDSTMIM